MPALPDQPPLPTDRRLGYARRVLMLGAMILGVAVFAALRAVLDSGHPMVRALPPAWRKGGGIAALTLELVILILVLALARAGAGWAVGAYLLYALASLAGAWLIVSRRI